MSANDSPTVSRRKLIKGAVTAALAGPLMMPAVRTRAAPAPLGTPVDPKDLIIAFGHVGPISDEGWTGAITRGARRSPKPIRV